MLKIKNEANTTRNKPNSIWTVFLRSQLESSK